MRPALLALTIVAAAACGGSDTTITQDVSADGGCSTPDGIESAGSSTPFEDVEEYLTGFRITEENEGEDPPADDNFGGVWGDRQGGMVVALVDCAMVDLEEVVRLGGGSEMVSIIQATASSTDVNTTKRTLAEELRRLDVPGDVIADSTTAGVEITVRVLDRSALTDDFGAGALAPFDIVEVDQVSTEGG